jgi:CheY-like chemotaxis protein
LLFSVRRIVKINLMKNEEVVNKKPSIFLADDDEDDVYFVKTAISELNAEIELKHFRNGRELLQALKNPMTALPDFVLLDLNMPVLDGRETLRLIRNQNSCADLPVIIFSTSNHMHEKEICYEFGANDYYTKPCNYPKYLEIIQSLKKEWIDKVEA